MSEIKNEYGEIVGYAVDSDQIDYSYINTTNTFDIKLNDPIFNMGTNSAYPQGDLGAIGINYFNNDEAARNAKLIEWLRGEFQLLFYKHFANQLFLSRKTKVGDLRLNEVYKIELFFICLRSPSNVFLFVSLYWRAFWGALLKRWQFFKLRKRQQYEKI